MDRIRLRAMAKINLGLDVTGVLPDGYHDVRMVMQTICLADLIEIRKERDRGIRIRTNLPYLPVDSRNLAYRAAQMMTEEFGLPGGLALSIRKRIPVAAGMSKAAFKRGVGHLLKSGRIEIGESEIRRKSAE